jgi:hypothetical protein
VCVEGGGLEPLWCKVRAIAGNRETVRLRQVVYVCMFAANAWFAMLEESGNGSDCPCEWLGRHIVDLVSYEHCSEWQPHDEPCSCSALTTDNLLVTRLTAVTVQGAYLMFCWGVWGCEACL